MPIVLQGEYYGVNWDMYIGYDPIYLGPPYIRNIWNDGSKDIYIQFNRKVKTPGAKEDYLIESGRYTIVPGEASLHQYTIDYTEVLESDERVVHICLTGAGRLTYPSEKVRIRFIGELHGKYGVLVIPFDKRFTAVLGSFMFNPSVSEDSATTFIRSSNMSIAMTSLNHWAPIENVEDVRTTFIGSALLSIMLMSIYSPVLLSARNIATDIEDPEDPESTIEDYGYRVEFVFDQYIPNAADYPGAFAIIDADDTVWYGQEASVVGRIVTVRFLNFNNAVNTITAFAYAGDLWNGHAMLEETSIGFNATGLVPFATDPPVPVSMSNIGNNVVLVTFDQSITDCTVQTGYVLSASEPDMSPGGELSTEEYEIDSIDHADPEIIYEDDGSGAYDDTVIGVDGIRLGLEA